MTKRNTLEKGLLFFALICLVLSHIFKDDKNIFIIGFYLFTVFIFLSTYIRFIKIVSTIWKIIWALCILSILFVIISILYLPTWNIKDLVICSMFLFVFSFNMLYKKNKEKFDIERDFELKKGYKQH